MDITEKTILLSKVANDSDNTNKNNKYRTFSSGLSTIFAIICIVDVFGVFPIVALPKSIIDCGIYGIIVICFVSTLQIYTASLLGRCWLIAEQIDPNVETKNRYPYSALAELTFGRKFSKVVTFFLDITIFTGGIPNLLVASQTLQLLARRVSENHFDLSFCYWIIVIGTLLCPLLWLGSPKDMKLLCTLSVALVLGTFILVITSMLFDNRDIQSESNTTGTSGTTENLINRSIWTNMLTAYGIITFQFDIHPTILTVHVDMDEKRKITKVVIVGFLASLTMFAISTSIAYWKYGIETKASLLGSLPSSIALHFAALLVALQLCLTLAVSNSALYQHLEDCLGISREFNHRRCILRTALSAIAILIAEAVPQFDIVMSLIGGTFIGPLVFVLPPLFHIRINQLKRQHEDEVQLAVFNNIVYNSLAATMMPSTSSAIKSFNNQPYQSNQQVDALKSSQDGLDNEIIQPVIKQSFYNNPETLLASLVITFGLCFTIGATYLNVSNVITITSFSQPCIYNLTLVSPF